MVYKNNETPPHSPLLHSHTLSGYTVHLVWEVAERGGDVREKVEGQQYTSTPVLV